MCRRTQAQGCILVAFGAGLLVSCIFSGFCLRIILAIVFLTIGLLLLH